MKLLAIVSNTGLYDEQIKNYTRYEPFYVFLSREVRIENGISEITCHFDTKFNLYGKYPYKDFKLYIKPINYSLDDQWEPTNFDPIEIDFSTSSVNLTYKLTGYKSHVYIPVGYPILELSTNDFDYILLGGKSYQIH